MLHEMGFENINDFIQKLNDFPTNNNGFMNEEEFVNKVIIPAEITTFTDLHTFLFKYFDELLYAVYLAAKDKTYKVKKPKDIHNL